MIYLKYINPKEKYLMSTYRRMKFDPMDIKVIILYILYHAGIPLSATEITDIILADSLMDFFEAHMYITMLIKDGQIEHIMSEDKYVLTEKGRDGAVFFYRRIPYSIRSKIEENLKIMKKEELMRELVSADFEAISEDEYLVHLKMIENRFDPPVIDLKLRVNDRNCANDLCIRWRNSYSEVYSEITSALTQKNPS